MAEYIKREALIAEFKRLKLGENSFIERVFADGVYAIIEQFPAADVAPVVHGRWIYKHRHRGGFRTYEVCDELGEKHSVRVDERYETDDPYCPECGKWNESVWLNYCPNCGVKMDGGADNAESV